MRSFRECSKIAQSELNWETLLQHTRTLSDGTRIVRIQRDMRWRIRRRDRPPAVLFDNVSRSAYVAIRLTTAVRQARARMYVCTIARILVC